MVAMPRQRWALTGINSRCATVNVGTGVGIYWQAGLRMGCVELRHIVSRIQFIVSGGKSGDVPSTIELKVFFLSLPAR
jgi:hypothetical protein